MKGFILIACFIRNLWPNGGVAHSVSNSLESQFIHSFIPLMASHAGYSSFFLYSLRLHYWQFVTIKEYVLGVFSFISPEYQGKTTRHCSPLCIVLFLFLFLFKLLELTDILGYFYLYYFVRVLFNIIIDMLWLWLAGLVERKTPQIFPRVNNNN